MIQPGSLQRNLTDRYLRFARDEARGRSPLYEALARGVADDAEILRFLSTLPPAKQQPNLLFASVRHVTGTPADFGEFKRRLTDHAQAIRATMLERATQTNEPARCAVLLPVLARLPQPLALLEVGASAGLCLLPDFYGYDFGKSTLRPTRGDGAFPIFRCAANTGTPVPTAMPRVVWRAGLDLHPLDAADPAQAAWLETLVWPEQTTRLNGLRAALRVAAAQKPRIVAGDLTGDALARLCREAPPDATLVVFHTAVLAYVAPEARRAFVDRVAALCPHWISNEAPGIASAPPPGSTSAGRFLLSVNGGPMAWTDPHGATLEWIAPA